VIRVTDYWEPTVLRSGIGRLLEELSWVGQSIRDYRDGGSGYENVLVAEVLLALDFLPRTQFLGGVIRAATGADEARSLVDAEIEQAELLVLPPELQLAPNAKERKDQLIIQPDGQIRSPSTSVLIEAKRIRVGGFQPEQLAREYVALMRDSGSKTPLLLLLLPAAPPVLVKGHGRLSVANAVDAHLASVLRRADIQGPNYDELTNGLADVVAWVTWSQLAQVVADQASSFASGDPSVDGSVHRLSALVQESISRHS